MAISFSRPDPSSPAAVAAANFTMARRGFDPDEVHEFLRMVAAELARLQERERFLERELRATQYADTPAAVAVDEDMVTKVLGEEAARILTTSREAASQIKSRAEETAARMLREATDEVQRLREEAEIEAARRRQDSASDAESEIQMAKQQGREMVNEARAYRERVLGELARRRELARQQIEGLVHGRDRLLQAFERARVAAVDVMADLTPLTDPGEFVNLSPATGPVPVIAPTSDDTAEHGAANTFSTHTSAEAVAAADAMLAAATAVIEASTGSAPAKPTMNAVPSIAAPAAPGDGDDAVLPSAPAEEAAPSLATETPSTEGQTTMGIQRTPRRRDTVVLLPEPAQQTRADGENSADGDDDDDGDDGADVDAEGSAASPRRGGREGRIAPVVSLFATGKEVPSRPQPPAPPQAPITQSRRSTPTAEPHSGHPVHQAAAEPVLDPAATAPAPGAPDSAPDTTTDTAADAGNPSTAAPRDSVDDLFARLRAARAGGVAERASAAQPSAKASAPVASLDPARTDGATKQSSAPRPGTNTEAATAATAKPGSTTKPGTTKPDAKKPTAEARTQRARQAPAVFQASPRDPAEASAGGDTRDLTDPTPFSRRDAELTPLIVAAARKLKRALADEQNDALLVLRRKAPVVELDALLPDGADHLRRYEQAVRDELVQAALAGAASLDDGSAVEHQRAIDAHHALGPAMEQLAASIINPLRERLDRAVKGAAGENAAVVDAVRAVYREWKTQRIDEHLDDVVRTAFGRGAFVVLAPGAPVCWTVDPNGPDCPDAEDNTLGGVVRAGEAFPTDHVCAPAHEGCRCMLQRARQ